MAKFGRSGDKTFTIANGASGSAVAAVDLGRPYAYILVTCEDAQRIQAGTTLSAQVGYGVADTLVALKMENDPGTPWVSGTLPTSGTLGFWLRAAFGAQQVRLVLSQNASGGSVIFKVRGLAGGI